MVLTASSVFSNNCATNSQIDVSKEPVSSIVLNERGFVDLSKVKSIQKLEIDSESNGNKTKAYRLKTRNGEYIIPESDDLYKRVDNYLKISNFHNSNN